MIVAIVAAIAAGLVGVSVVLANPKRTTNQFFGLVSLVATVWLAFVVMTFVDGNRVFWTRANAIVSAFSPWGLWLLTQAIVRPASSRTEILGQSLGWFAIGVAAIPISLTESFAWASSTSDMLERGRAYYLHATILVVSYVAAVFVAAREMNRQRGIRRTEIQFLVLNMGVGALLCLAFVLSGNFFSSVTIKLFGLVVLGAAYVTTAWGIASERIFEIHEVFASLGRWAGTATIVSLTFFGTWLFTEDLALRSASLFGSAIISGYVAIWSDRKLRALFGTDDERRLAKARRDVIALARTEPNTEAIVGRLEQLLCEVCQTRLAKLMFDKGSRFGSGDCKLERESAAYRCLAQLGWATPETLIRRRTVQGLSTLHDFLTANSFGLVLTVPRDSPTPSMLVALGIKRNERPYTFPEVQRLQMLAELMDNILTRSRLTTQAVIEAKLEHLAIMSRGLAHDLKNLITPISSFLVHTERTLAPETAEAEVHAAAKRSVRVMNDYVREALFFANRLEPRFEAVSTGRIFTLVRELTAPRAAQRGVKVVIGLESDHTLVADSVLLQRMLGNLIGNAIDASAAGQSVSLAATLNPGRTIRLTVVDQGAGIPPEHLGRIFDPYFTTKEFGDEVRGFGLGLTISQKIVHLHHGTISVQSRPGCGTAVIIDLPLHQPGVNAMTDTALAPAPPAALSSVPTK